MDIYDYVFHFNPHTELWYAIPRDSYLEYWSNRETKGVLKSRDVNALAQLVSKGEEFVNSVALSS